MERGWEYERGDLIIASELVQSIDSTDITLTPKIRMALQLPLYKRIPVIMDQVQLWANKLKGFRKFPPQVQKMILSVARYEKWNMNRLLIREGHPAVNFYVLLDGAVEISIVDRVALAAAKSGLRARKSFDDVLRTRNTVESKGRETDLERAYSKLLGTMISGGIFNLT
jgi:hypothetical protein